MAADTTSQPWTEVLPHGLIAFAAEEAASLGQRKSFLLDLRRLAYVPLTTRWFPRLDDTDAGVLSRAPKLLRDRIDAVATDLVKRRPETLSRGGPFWTTEICNHESRLVGCQLPVTVAPRGGKGKHQPEPLRGRHGSNFDGWKGRVGGGAVSS